MASSLLLSERLTFHPLTPPRVSCWNINQIGCFSTHKYEVNRKTKRFSNKNDSSTVNNSVVSSYLLTSDINTAPLERVLSQLTSTRALWKCVTEASNDLTLIERTDNPADLTAVKQSLDDVMDVKNMHTPIVNHLRICTSASLHFLLIQCLFLKAGGENKWATTWAGKQPPERNQARSDCHPLCPQLWTARAFSRVSWVRWAVSLLSHLKRTWNLL